MEPRPLRSRWAHWAAFCLIALIGLAVRLPQLGARPMHTDEAVNAYIVGQLLAGEPFTYDPRDRHGPALAVLALPIARLQGAKSFSELTESELRLTSVVAGTITILLFGVAVEPFGFIPCVVAALLFAVAPLPVYYDRDFIHESLFCAATLGFILSGWRAFRTCSIGHAALAGACAALMLTTKETAVLHFGTLAVAALAYRVWNLRGKRVAGSLRPGSSLRLRLLLAAVGAFTVIVATLFTWFGRNGRGLLDLLRMVPNVLARASGQGHEKPFWYYGQLLTGGWSGGVILAAACFGLFIILRKRDASPFQWLTYYAVLIAAIYSFIPYKTPWLLLNIWLPLTLFAGVAAELLWRGAAKLWRWPVAVSVFCILAAVASVLIAHDTRLRVFLLPADESNPYAYAQTSDDILGLPTEIAEMARRSGISNPRIAVIASDPWPLPWYLRQFHEVGFWQPGQQVEDADFFVTSTEAADRYADRLGGFRPEFFGVRPGVLVLLWLPEPG